MISINSEGVDAYFYKPLILLNACITCRFYARKNTCKLVFLLMNTAKMQKCRKKFQRSIYVSRTLAISTPYILTYTHTYIYISYIPTYYINSTIFFCVDLCSLMKVFRLLRSSNLNGCLVCFYTIDTTIRPY